MIATQFFLLTLVVVIVLVISPLASLLLQNYQRDELVGNLKSPTLPSRPVMPYMGLI